MNIDIITIFPDMVRAILGESIMKRAAESGRVNFRVVNLRDFTRDAHRTTDDRPYGGGPGMVMKPEPIFDAVESLRGDDTTVILTTPQGERFSQPAAGELAGHSHLVFICGHYEGVDERVREALVDREFSIGDYVLTNGVLPATVIADAVVRLIPGVLGGEGATDEESFGEGLLEYPHYTRPPEYRGMKVPEILSSGDHGRIARWRREKAEERTRDRRPDLWERYDRPRRGGRD